MELGKSVSADLEQILMDNTYVLRFKGMRVTLEVRHQVRQRMGRRRKTVMWRSCERIRNAILDDVYTWS